MLTLQQDVVPHMKVTARAGGVPTAHWSANYTPHTVVPPCRAFYDRLARTMCLCLVALSCSHCDVDVVNPTLQIRRIGRRSAVALSSPMCQITADVPVIIGLTLALTTSTLWTDLSNTKNTTPKDNEGWLWRWFVTGRSGMQCVSVTRAGLVEPII